MKSVQVVAVVWLGLSVLSISQAAPPTEREARLKELGKALVAYAFENEGRLPGQLSVLCYQAYVDDLEAFLQAGAKETISYRTEIDTRTSFVLVAEKLDRRSKTPIL